MRRKNLFLSVAAAVAILGVSGTVFWLLLQHEPHFYRRSVILPGSERKHLSTVCFGNGTKLYNHILDGKGEWDVTFTDAQINSYFQEDFNTHGDAKVLNKFHISDPRVAIEGDRIRLGLRFGHGFWSTVFSLNIRLWLAPKDINVVAMEIESRQCGGLPIPSQSILEKISELARWQNLDVTWYRQGTHPVALLRFQADRPRPSVLLRRLEVRQGQMTIGGLSLEPLQRQAWQGLLPDFAHGREGKRPFSGRLFAQFGPPL